MRSLSIRSARFSSHCERMIVVLIILDHFLIALLVSAGRATEDDNLSAGNGDFPVLTLPDQPGCRSVAPRFPHSVHRARRRSTSDNASAPRRMINYRPTAASDCSRTRHSRPTTITSCGATARVSEPGRSSGGGAWPDCTTIRRPVTSRQGWWVVNLADQRTFCDCRHRQLSRLSVACLQQMEIGSDEPLSHGAESPAPNIGY